MVGCRQTHFPSAVLPPAFGERVRARKKTSVPVPPSPRIGGGTAVPQGRQGEGHVPTAPWLSLTPIGARLSAPAGRTVTWKPKRIVADGYDHIGDGYHQWAATLRPEERERRTADLTARLPLGAAVLDLGCGTGIPTTQRLAQRYAVTAVEISARQAEAARQNVPTATVIQADMATLDFPSGCFDAVVAFSSIIHLPRGEHLPLLQAAAGWLRPGGLLLATLGVRDNPAGVEEDWLGAPMYWSHFDGAANRRLVEQAGFRILSADEERGEEHGRQVSFLWVLAVKPAPGWAE